MGVVNATPDSFSDGGRFAGTPAAVAHALSLARAGADILDLGGESTRPGAEPVSEAEELNRVMPVLAALSAISHPPLSIDTTKPGVARRAVEAGAVMWNDVSALDAPDAPDTAAALGCDIVLMHRQGDPRSMQRDPRYGDVVGEVEASLLQRAQVALDAGVCKARILIDPGIGFGKTLEHNLALLAGLERLTATGFRVLLGVSRKRFIAALDPSAQDPNDRIGGSIAAALAGARAGCAVIRVHDVRETVQALAVQGAILSATRRA